MNDKVSLAVDIGGTFTDVVLFRGADVFNEKTLTTPDNLLDGFYRGVDAVLARSGQRPADVDGVVHATTIVTNVLIERKGARTAMNFTHGFSDILNMRDCRRYDMYDLQIEFPRPLVESEDVFTVRERILSDGSVRTPPIDEDDVDAVCRALSDSGIRSVGICLLNAYKNGSHEQQLAREIRQRLP